MNGEQDEDLRQEHEHAAGAGDHAVEQQPAQRPRRHDAREPAAQGLHAGVDEVLRRLGPAEHRLEHEEQHHRQQQRACDRVQHHGIEARERGEARRHAVAGLGEHAPHLALRGLDVGRARRRRRLAAAARLRQHLAGEAVTVDGVDELLLTAGAHRHGRHHRHPERALERGAVERVAALLGDVAHVERDDHRAAEALELEHQAQVEAQVRGIDHAHQQVRRRLGRVAAEHHVARDGLIEGRGLEAVGAGQVDHAEDAPGARADEAAFLALDGDAGVVGDLLAAAGETIEERGLAAVGDADERQAQLRRGECRGRRRVHGARALEAACAAAVRTGAAAAASCTQTLWASRRRRARVV